jgi:hypothetical protein
MPMGTSGDSAEPPEGIEQPGEADSPDGAEPPPSGGRRYTWLTRHGRSPVMWAAAGLVVIGGAGAIMATHESGGEAQPRAQAALCGLVSCADVPSAASSRQPAPEPSTPLPSLPPDTARPVPAPTPAAPPTPALAKVPAPAPTPVRPAVPATAPRPAPTPTRVPAPWPAWPTPPAHGPWPPSGPPPAQRGSHGLGRHNHWSSWWWRG